MKLRATLLASIVALFILVSHCFGIQIRTEPLWLPIALLTIPVLALPYILEAMMISPLASAAGGFSPHIISLYRKDNSLTEAEHILNIMPVVFIAASIGLVSLKGPLALAILLIWIIFLGLTLDSFRTTLVRSLHFLDPINVVQKIADLPIQSIEDTMERIDQLSEVGLSSIQNGSSFLAQNTCQSLVSIQQQFLDQLQESTTEPEKSQAAMCTLYHMIEQLEMLYIEAESEGYYPVCHAIISSLGKLAATGAIHNHRYALAPIKHLFEIGMDALEENDSDTALRVSCTIQEVARIIIDESEQTSGFFETFRVIVNQLADLAKQLFRNDKTTPVPTLMTPFVEIKKSIESSLFANTDEGRQVIEQLDDVLEQFSALAHVMLHKDGPQSPKQEE